MYLEEDRCLLDQIDFSADEQTAEAVIQILSSLMTDLDNECNELIEGIISRTNDTSVERYFKNRREGVVSNLGRELDDNL